MKNIATLWQNIHKQLKRKLKSKTIVAKYVKFTIYITDVMFAFKINKYCN